MTGALFCLSLLFAGLDGGAAGPADAGAPAAKPLDEAMLKDLELLESLQDLRDVDLELLLELQTGP